MAVAFAAHNVADDGNPIYFAIVMTRLNNEPMRLCPLDSLQYGAQNEAYKGERERKTPKAVYLQRVSRVEAVRSAQNEMFT